MNSNCGKSNKEVLISSNQYQFDHNGVSVRV